MNRLPQHLLTLGCLAIGGGAWLLGGRSLFSDSQLKTPLNPLGINGSPYGEVFAMAMQEPIDTYFHNATSGAATRGNGGTDEHHDSVKVPARDAAGFSLGSRFEGLLTSLEKASVTRTNPKPASDAQKRYLRRQVEDKLRFAYQLDPSHYANYNSLHFFLTEPELGTRPELTSTAAKLAEDTIGYCLKQNNDPRPALTAAAAASNVLELMFNDRMNAKPRFTTSQMRDYLNLLDHCLNRYAVISMQWEKTKNWELLSPQRITECNDRFNFICHFRESAEGTILRFEGHPQPAQAAN